MSMKMLRMPELLLQWSIGYICQLDQKTVLELGENDIILNGIVEKQFCFLMEVGVVCYKNLTSFFSQSKLPQNLLVFIFILIF